MKDKDEFSETGGIRIMDYVYAIRERWILGISVGIILAGIFSLYMFSRTPEYTSSLQLLVDLAPENVVDMDKVVNETAIIKSQHIDSLLNGYLIEIKSRKFRDYVISGLDKQTIGRIIQPYRKPELAEPKVSGILRRSIKVSLELKAKAYIISATHRDAEVAADLANLYAARYIEYILSDVGSSNASALLFLRENAEKMQNSILEDKRELQRLQKKHNIISTGDSRSIAINKIISLNERRTELDVEKQSFETILEQLKARGVDIDIEDESQITAALEISEISQFGGIAETKAELDRALIKQKEIELTYLEKHPEYIRNKKNITELKIKLKSEISLRIKSFLTSSDKIVAQIDKISKSIALLEEETQRLDDLAIIFQGLETKIDNDKKTLTQIESRLNETTISSQLSKANMRVIDEAVETNTPSYPNYKRTIMTAVFLFGLSFIALPLGLNLINDKLKMSWDVEEFIGKPLLGEIVTLKKDQQQNIHNLIMQPNLEDSSIVDTFRAIYHTIKLGISNADRRVQVVTSAIPSEGKTIFSINYAAVCAQHEKRVLLIDCDLRKPQVPNYTGTKTDAGLVRWFDNDVDLPANEQLHETLGIQRLESGVYFLPAGKASNRSTELVERQKFRQLIAQLSEEFDYIIIDTPPLKAFPDAMFIADYAQDVIFVCRFNKVSKAIVKQLIERLDQTAATVRGVVINQSKMKHKKDGYYGYYASKY